METESKELSFLRSSLAPESPVFDNTEFPLWFRDRAIETAFHVRRIPFDAMDEWKFESSTRNLVHSSGRFFRIEGLRVETDFEDAGHWDQPIINQPEIGILGILSKQFSGVRHFLMQAKAEPGNINTLQLSPTVQATQSNYQRVHGGSVPSYFEYFDQATTSSCLVDQLQTEQGSRFLKKRNRNMIVDVGEHQAVPVLDDFRWLTLGEIKKLHRTENLVNMDAKSVISCIPYFRSTAPESGPLEDAQAESVTGFGKDLLASAVAFDNAMHSMDTLNQWLIDAKGRYRLRAKTIALDDVRNWMITEDEIVHETREHFSVIAVSVEAGQREVKRWTQPLIKDASRGLHGFITQKHASILHFLVQAKVEPGNFSTPCFGWATV